MIRGIDRTVIFRNDEDRESFLDRLGEILMGSSTPCYAWSLLSNHAHFLFRTGKIPIARVMRKLLTGYAVTFNRRYRRPSRLASSGFYLICPLLLLNMGRNQILSESICILFRFRLLDK